MVEAGRDRQLLEKVQLFTTPTPRTQMGNLTQKGGQERSQDLETTVRAEEVSCVTSL